MIDPAGGGECCTMPRRAMIDCLKEQRSVTDLCIYSEEPKKSFSRERSYFGGANKLSARGEGYSAGTAISYFLIFR
jgi:hypothetical protein